MPANSPTRREPIADARFPKALHLRTSEEFKHVFGRRCSVADGTLIVYGSENELGFSRLGLSVSRKVGNAVRRNRWKRLIREAFRLQRRRMPPGLDLVVIPRREVRPDLAALEASLGQLARRVQKKLGGKRR